MKTKIIIVIILLILFAVLTISIYIKGGKTGPHGGVVKKAEKYNIELKTSTQYLYAFLLDEKNNPILNKGISCEACLTFSNDTKITYILLPYKNDGFMMENMSPGFSSCKIIFNVFGKSEFADFENENTIATKNNK